MGQIARITNDQGANQYPVTLAEAVVVTETVEETNGQVTTTKQVQTTLKKKIDDFHDALALFLPKTDGLTDVAYDTTSKKFTKTKNGTTSDIVSLATLKTAMGLGDAGDYVAANTVGKANGVASLDANGHVPSTQLPSYVDDVLEGYLNEGTFYKIRLQEKTSSDGTVTFGYSYPYKPESGKIYVDLASNKTYRWGGSAYAEISASLAVGTTAGTAYDGASGKALADDFSDHIQNRDPQHIHVTASEKQAWNAKYNKPSGGIPKSDLAQEVQNILDSSLSCIRIADVAGDDLIIAAVTGSI